MIKYKPQEIYWSPVQGGKNEKKNKTTSAASYPDVSLSMNMYAQRKAGRRQRASLAVCTLPMVPCGSSPVTRVSCSPLRWEKRSAWGGGCNVCVQGTFEIDFYVKQKKNSSLIYNSQKGYKVLNKVCGRGTITDRRYMKGIPFSWKIVYKRVRGWIFWSFYCFNSGLHEFFQAFWPQYKMFLLSPSLSII